MSRTKAIMEVTVEMFRRLKVGVYTPQGEVKKELPKCLRRQPLMDLSMCLDATEAIPAGSVKCDEEFQLPCPTVTWRP